METGFYVILLLLVFLKLMIWVCVFYSRARRRQIIAQRGLIIVQGGASRDRDMIITREHLPGRSHVGLDNPTVVATPPSYEEVQRTKCNEEKPPSYDQIVSGNAFVPTSSSINERPPAYSPVAPDSQQMSSHSGQTTLSNTSA